MKFNDRYMYTILCEDRQTLEFIKHLLKIQGINTRKIYSIIAESGARKMFYYLQNLKEYERVIDSLSIAKEEYLKLCNNQA